MADEARDMDGIDQLAPEPQQQQMDPGEPRAEQQDGNDEPKQRVSPFTFQPALVLGDMVNVVRGAASRPRADGARP